MANELIINYPTGATLYALLFDATGQMWNGSSFVAPSSASWTDYDIAMTEAATATGVYRGTMPAVAAGVYSWTVRKQAGGTPAVTDITVGTGSIQWGGTAEVTLSSRATQTSVDDLPDAILKRDWSLVTGEASRSVLNALRFLRNKWSVSGATLTVTKEDDATTAWASTLTSDAAADPVTGSDPA